MYILKKLQQYLLKFKKAVVKKFLGVLKRKKNFQGSGAPDPVRVHQTPMKSATLHPNYRGR